MAQVSEPQDEANGLDVVFLCYAVIDNYLEERVQNQPIEHEVDSYRVYTSHPLYNSWPDWP